MTGCRMLRTASTLGVIAIVFVMSIATASESSSGATEHVIDHPVVVEEDRRVQEEQIARNQSDLARSNDTDDRMTQNFELTQPAFDGLSNVSRLVQEVSLELQRDQSVAAGSFAAEQNDLRQLELDRVESEQRIEEHVDVEDRARDWSRTFLASTEPDRASVPATTVLWLGSNANDQLNRFPAEDRSPPAYTLDQEHETLNDDRAKRPRVQSNEQPATTTSIRETFDSESRLLEQKNVDDIRAISFQVPAIEDQPSDTRQREQPRNPADTRKDHSRPVNNLLLAGGKSTKGFYEIKPSIRTEMEDDQQTAGGTLRPLPGKKFVLPSVDSAFGKFGPYFEDGDQGTNITARIGSTMLLDCKIGMLGDKEVTWLQQHGKDSLRLLTVGRKPYSVDQRISLNFRYPSNWRLQILYATPRDSGLYKCQVATHPPLVKQINVVVTAPELTITDDSGRVVSKERHLKAGSALKLRCEARDVLESLDETVVWTRGEETLTDDVSENRTSEISSGKEVLVIVSTLIVERASPRHAGNYSCVVPGKARTTIAVHVLNGELPAAVHDGNGVSRAFLNLWLIHLTISYVFSR